MASKLTKFFKNYHTRSYSKGELILVQGEVPSCIYVVKSGHVKTYNLTNEGDEKPIMYKDKKALFPIGWAYGKTRYAQYYYEAYTNCKLYCIPREEFIQFIKNNPDALYESHIMLVDRYINYQMRVNALEQSKAHAKVVNTLHFLCLRFGKEIREDTVRIELPFTQQDLANLMGLTRETTGIELKKLEEEKILTRKRQHYIIKTNRLNELLDEEYDINQIQE